MSVIMARLRVQRLTGSVQWPRHHRQGIDAVDAGVLGGLQTPALTFRQFVHRCGEADDQVRGRAGRQPRGALPRRGGSTSRRSSTLRRVGCRFGCAPTLPCPTSLHEVVDLTGIPKFPNLKIPDLFDHSRGPGRDGC